MNVRWIGLFLGVACFPLYSGCTGGAAEPVSGPAVIVGSVSAGGAGGKLPVAAQLVCPDLVVTLNGTVVDFELDDDCTFLVDEVQPATSVTLVVELPGLGITGSLALADVGAAEFIEVLVEFSDDSLSISLVRRATPDPVDELPVVVDANNVTIFLPAGVYNQTLTVDGNNFTLVGQAGENCDSDGWTIITGDLLVRGNNATFRNVRFEGPVEIQGNNASFINTCVGGELLIFGNNTEFDDDDGDDENDDGEDDGEVDGDDGEDEDE